LAYKYTVAWGAAKGAEGLLAWIDEMLDRAKVLKAKQDGVVDRTFSIGHNIKSSK